MSDSNGTHAAGGSGSEGRRRLCSVIVPCFNEQEVVPEFYRRAAAVADGTPGWAFEIVFVDDASTDDTYGAMAAVAARDDRVKVLRFARNRGQQVAMLAGLDFARGDAAVLIDGDLQDPPEVIPRMLELIDAGYDIVHAQHRSREGETWLKLASARAFYALLERIGGVRVVKGSSEFRCASRAAVETARAFREPHRFLRLLFSEFGFRSCVLRYDRDARFAGVTKYSLWKLFRVAADAIFSFSSAPIRAILWCSVTLWSIGGLYLAYVLLTYLTVGIDQPGFTAIVFLLTIYTGTILLAIAVIGQYIGRVFEQGQRRPLYWLAETRNVDGDRFDETIPEAALSRRTTAAAREAERRADPPDPEVFVVERPEGGWASAMRRPGPPVHAATPIGPTSGEPTPSGSTP